MITVERAAGPSDAGLLIITDSVGVRIGVAAGMSRSACIGVSGCLHSHSVSLD